MSYWHSTAGRENIKRAFADGFLASEHVEAYIQAWPEGYADWYTAKYEEERGEAVEGLVDLCKLADAWEVENRDRLQREYAEIKKDAILEWCLETYSFERDWDNG